MKDRKSIDSIINEALAIEEEDAKEAGHLGFVARTLIQATLPHKKVNGNEFTRTNGNVTLSMMAPSKIGLPFGNIPRLVMVWATTEAIRTKERELFLGDNLNSFLRELNLGEPSGGRTGNKTRLRDQLTSLCSSTITYIREEPRKTEIGKFNVIDKAKLWWDDKDKSEQIELFQSSITLSEDFFQEIINASVPLDMRAIKALKQSPLALDVYCWLTYRMSYLRKPTVIPWESLALQFGSEYTRTRDFKAAFLEQLKKVHLVYPGAKLEDMDNGLLLKPSKTAIDMNRYKLVDK